MYVVDAAGIPPSRWKAPYADDATGEPRWRPPYPRREPRRAPARPRRGHFDHLAVGTRAFWACHVFATVRCVREIWEHCFGRRSEEHTSELQSHSDLVCRLLLEKKKKKTKISR